MSYNLALDLVDRHVIEGRGDVAALIFEDSAGFEATYTYRDLAILSNRFAHVLRGVGVGRQDRVFFRVPNHPSFYIGALACAKAGAVFIPSSTLFKEDEVSYRLRDSGAVVAVTTAKLAREIEAVRDQCPSLREVLIVDDAGEQPWTGSKSGMMSVSTAMESARDHFVAVDTQADDPAFIAYSSGTTGDPKGIVHAQRYARSYDYLVNDWHGYGQGDVCACPPEIGWVLPVASSFLYAFRAGTTVLLYREREPGFRPEEWYRLIQKHRVTNLVGTPTIYRMLLTVENAHRFDVSCLKHGTSAGEPLPPDTYKKVQECFGFAPLDGIGMSECMVYAHNRVDDHRPGSCGTAGGGLELAVLDEDLKPVTPGEPGVLCVRRSTHPGMMLEYLNKPEQTAEVLRGEWYVSGDVVREEDGAYFFEGRADDVMNCSGFRISPFEVESAMNAHPAVLEAAAVESPDAMKGQVVKGFCTLREGFAASDELAAEIRAHVKSRLAPFKAPRKIEFVDALPKTQSGKIKRRVLRAGG